MPLPKTDETAELVTCPMCQGKGLVAGAAVGTEGMCNYECTDCKVKFRDEVTMFVRPPCPKCARKAFVRCAD